MVILPFMTVNQVQECLKLNLCHIAPIYFHFGLFIGKFSFVPTINGSSILFYQFTNIKNYNFILIFILIVLLHVATALTNFQMILYNHVIFSNEKIIFSYIYFCLF